MIHESTVIQRALLSVFDKTGIVELAEHLHLRGIELLSTGQTAQQLIEHGLPVIPVSEYTGFPEIMDGRVKTLHPKIHGGILGRRDEDAETMIAHNIPDIDLVIVNLYPFSKEAIIENIDIGGPTMIRAAAKNHAWCTVLVDPQDYADFLNMLDEHEGTVPASCRLRYAAKAFAHTAMYENNIADYFRRQLDASTEWGDSISFHAQRKQLLRYGENPHQQAAFYTFANAPCDSIARAAMLQGKPLSFNNIIDADAALECVKLFDMPACVIVKHANPCGVALGGSLQEAYEKAFACDPTSAFGGIMALNRPVDDTLLRHIFSHQFVEVVIAPSFTESACRVGEEKPNCRLLCYSPTTSVTSGAAPWIDLRSVNGGLLVQSWPREASTDNFTIVSRQHPDATQMHDLRFAWHVVKFVKSNAIVYAKQGQTLGIGAGQMSRIFSTEIAALKATEHGHDLHGAVMASDAFFPFTDNLEKAHALGIRAVIQPGGSMRDNDVIACADDLGMIMIFTHQRFFRH